MPAASPVHTARTPPSLLCPTQVMQLLGLQKPGPELGRVMAEALEWQLTHPQGTLEGCQQHLRAWWQTQQQ